MIRSIDATLAPVVSAAPRRQAPLAPDATQRLPTELKQEILRWTAPKDFFALSGVNRAWHEASHCVPLLRDQLAHAGAQHAWGRMPQPGAEWDLARPLRQALHRHTGIGYLLSYAPHRVQTLLPPDKHLQQVALSPRGDCVSVAYNGGITFFDATSPQIALQSTFDSSAVIVRSRFSQDGSGFMFMTEAGGFFSYPSRDLLSTPNTIAQLNLRPHRAYVAADGLTWIMHHVDTNADTNVDINVAFLIDIRAALPALYPLETEQELSCAALSEDGAWALTGDRGLDVLLWNTRTDPPSPQRLQPDYSMMLYAEFEFLKSEILALALSPDNRLAAAAIPDGRIALWDLRDVKAAPRVIRGGQDMPLALAISRDNRFLASAAADSTVNIYNIAAQPITHITLRPQPARIFSVAFSDDNRFVLTAASNNAIDLHDFDKDADV